MAFYAKGVHVGTESTGRGRVYGVTWMSAVAGSYALTAVATDNAGGTRTSSPVSISVTPPPGRVNVAAGDQRCGGEWRRRRSSAVSAASAASSTGIAKGWMGQRRGLGRCARITPGRTGWRCNSAAAWQIDEVDVFTLQDNYSAPSDPTPA